MRQRLNLTMLTEREVRELAGDEVDTDEFPRPVQYGPEGRKWDEDTVEAWVNSKKDGLKKQKVKRPKDEGVKVETRPVE